MIEKEKEGIQSHTTDFCRMSKTKSIMNRISYWGLSAALLMSAGSGLFAEDSALPNLEKRLSAAQSKESDSTKLGTAKTIETPENLTTKTPDAPSAQPPASTSSQSLETPEEIVAEKTIASNQTSVDTKKASNKSVATTYKDSDLPDINPNEDVSAKGSSLLLPDEVYNALDRYLENSGVVGRGRRYNAFQEKSKLVDVLDTYLVVSKAEQSKAQFDLLSRLRSLLVSPDYESRGTLEGLFQEIEEKRASHLIEQEMSILLSSRITYTNSGRTLQGLVEDLEKVSSISFHLESSAFVRANEIIAPFIFEKTSFKTMLDWICDHYYLNYTLFEGEIYLASSK